MAEQWKCYGCGKLGRKVSCDCVTECVYRTVDGKQQVEVKESNYPRHHAALRQIRAVCADNDSRTCDHKMAFDFVRQIVQRIELE